MMYILDPDKAAASICFEVPSLQYSGTLPLLAMW